MAVLHSIKAQLYDNVLTENPNDFIARVASEKSLNIKDICLAATTRGGSDVSAAAMEHAVNLWLKEMAYSLCDGFSVNAGYFTAQASIRGSFLSPTEKFNEFSSGADPKQLLKKPRSTIFEKELAVA